MSRFYADTQVKFQMVMNRTDSVQLKSARYAQGCRWVEACGGRSDGSRRMTSIRQENDDGWFLVKAVGHDHIMFRRLNTGHVPMIDACRPTCHSHKISCQPKPREHGACRRAGYWQQANNVTRCHDVITFRLYFLLRMIVTLFCIC